MIFQIYDCIYNFVCLVLMVFLCNSFCEKRRIKSSLVRILVCVIWFILFNVLTVFFAEQSFVLRLLTTFALHLLALSLLFKTRIYKLILLLLLYFGIGICSDFIMFNFQQALFPGVSDIDSINQSLASLVMGTISLFLQSIIILVIKRIATNIRYDELNTTDLLKHSLFPLFSIGIIVSLCLQNDNDKQYQVVLMIIMSCSLLLMNVYVFFFLRNETTRKIEQQRNVLLVNHAEEITALYNQSCLDREEQARSAHEYKNVMYALEGLLSAGKYQEAEDYVKSRNEEFTKVTNVVNTGNSVVNAVFNTKYAEAKRKGINVRFEFSDLSNVTIEYTDLVTILANLLNNSIEACEKCEVDNRTIDVVIKTLSDSELMISIKNTYTGTIQKYKDHFLTSKADSANHGFGLENIRSVVTKHDGFMDIDNDEDDFIVTIVIKKQ